MSRLNIKNFQDFINEEYKAVDLSQVLQRFYMLVRKPYPKTSEHILAKMIGDTRNILFDQIIVNETTYTNLPFQPAIPILNFTEDNSLVQRMIDDKLIDVNVLYNKPDQSSLVSDKVIFHKTFYDNKFVPLTVFTIEDAKSLKFPIIAKPAQGKSAKGIKKFDTPEDLVSSMDKFDVFSEMIDIAKEYRGFCFKDSIIEINERIKVGDEDFLANSESETDFYYKKVNINKYQYRAAIEELLLFCRSKVQLDFFSIDFAETPDGTLQILEMNSRTGMGTDKMVELYTLIHKDFYKKKPNSTATIKMEEIVKAWDKAYASEKGSKINECTTVAGKLDNVTFLFKNRDRSYTPATKIIHEVFNKTEIVYYTDQTGWIEGMNEHGVGFVFSAFTTKDYTGYGPSYYVTDEPKHKSRFDRFADGIKKVLTSKNADEAIKNLYKSKKSGSFLIGDSKDIYEVEVVEGKMKKRKISFSKEAFYAKTNHGTLFPTAGHQPSGDSIKRAGSEIRRHQAVTQLNGIIDISEIPTRMKFQQFDPSSPLNVFRTDPEEYTISQCLFDLTNLTFYFFHDKTTANSLKIEDKVKDPKIKIDSRKI